MFNEPPDAIAQMGTPRPMPMPPILDSGGSAQIIAFPALLARRLSAPAWPEDPGPAEHAVLALDQAGRAAALLSRTGCLLATNARFREGLALFGQDLAGGLRLNSPVADTALLAAIAAGVLEASAIALRPGLLHLVPLDRAARETFGGALCLLLLNRFGVPPLPSAAVLQAVLNLTVGEARLARALASGDSLAAAARAQRLRPATARTYLRRVLAKAGVRRQAELMRVVCSLAPPVR